MRRFRHLTETKLREIHVGYLAGEPKLAIARRIGVDNSTVYYHINKIKHLPEAEVIALVQPKSKCSGGHTSVKCLVCGMAGDNIKTQEFQEIIALRKQVRDLERQLSLLNETPSASSPNPVVRVSG